MMRKKYLLCTFIFFILNAVGAQESGLFKIDNFADGEAKLIRYTLPDSVLNPPDKLTFKMFKLPFVGFKSPKLSEERVYYAILASPLGIEKGDYALEVFDDKNKIADLTVPMIARSNLKTEEVLSAKAEAVLPQKPAIIEKVAREDLELNALFKVITPVKLWNKGFYRPVSGSMSSPFGIYRVYTKHLRRRTHWGIDYRAPIGTPIKASGAGKIVFAKDLYFPGKTIVIDHGLGLFTGYSHLSKMKVKVGDTVKAGEIIGNTGISGKNTGPLLHWFAVNGRVKVDPATLLDVNLPQ